ncbi:unnamed protein product [Clavelina lepadiformis]|uniref:Anaphase-promoting complex subunit 1 n=1 Tax=Clavelina lepadiformis TaxID=159417 RepID=A0ABP0FZX1_CLALP
MSSSPVIAPKKARPTVKAESKDWEYLLESKYNEEDDPSSVFITDNEQSILFLSQSQSYSLHKRKSMDTSLAGDSSLLTNQILTSVFCAIHLVYEEQKLSSLTWQNIPTMSPLLYRLASDLQQYKFLYSYALDNPTLFAKILLSKFQDTCEDGDLESRLPGYFSSDSKSCVFENLDDLVRTGSCKYPIPYIPGVTVRTERIFKIFDCLFNKGTTSSTVPLSPLMKTMFSASASGQDDVVEDKHLKMVDRQPAERVLLYMVNGGIDEAEITAWPPGVSLPILESLYQSCENPDLSLPLSALKLLGRTDLVEQTLPSAGDWKTAGLCPSTDPLRFAWTDQEKNNSQSEKDHSELISILEEGHQNTEENEQEKSSPSAGLDDNVTRLLFPNDHRMADAYNLLQSTKPMKILLTQEAGIDDREFMEQKEGRLAQLLNRSMALCIGRGMMMYRTQNPSAVDAVELPELELTGKDLNNATVSFANSNIELPSETFQWPRFHNGVAATLAIQDDKTSMSWVHINKERYTFPESSEPTFEHSGALFGFGLNHHLQELQTLNIHEYLQKSHEMTTIGLLLGLASDKCASCDLATMRLLSVHISALLPPTSTVLDIPHRVQAAAVMAVGFLCLGSSQRLVAEVMLREIDRFPSTETEVSPEREAYSLSSGFALGMVLLGKGDRMPELSDLNISEKLFHYMTGKHKRNYTYNRTHEYYSPSHSSNSNNFNQILEGDQVNTEVTCPGATMALALMFLKTNNQAVADWFIAPDTMSLLETIKPQHLMLRTMTRALILWDQVVPSVEWVESHIPFVIRQHLKDVQTMQVNHNDEDVDVDEHTILQCHVAIIAGACLALGLRFAGSQEKAAYVTLHHYVQFFISITKQPQMSLPSHPLEVIGHRLFETCLTSCLISMCMVVAGSGNLEGLQICRYLHHSVEGKINYGMQMATHMALGFLFLGGCRYSLSTSNKAIAALLVAIYPSFPAKSSDNRYHLQAFRHLYVMAVEKRLLVPIDVATKRPCYTQVAIQYLPTAYNNSPTIKMIAPCMLPEATYLQSIAVEDKRHLPVHVNVNKRPNKLGQITDDGIYVQLRPGFLPYVQDPKGHCTFLSRSRKRPPAAGNIKHSGDQLLSYLFSLSETDQSSLQKSNLSRLTSLLQEQRHHSKTFFLYLSLLQICCHIEDKMSPDPLSAWQIRLARNFISQSSNGSSQNNKNDPLMQAISVSLAKMFDNFVADKKSILQSVIFNRRSDASSRILTRSQSQHEKDQSILKEFRSSDLHKLACYLICNNLSLPLSDKTQQGFASPTKRRSRSKADESLSSILNQLKQLDNAQVPHLTAFQMLYC